MTEETSSSVPIDEWRLQLLLSAFNGNTTRALRAILSRPHASSDAPFMRAEIAFDLLSNFRRLWRWSLVLPPNLQTTAGSSRFEVFQTPAIALTSLWQVVLADPMCVPTIQEALRLALRITRLSMPPSSEDEQKKEGGGPKGNDAPLIRDQDELDEEISQALFFSFCKAVSSAETCGWVSRQWLAGGGDDVNALVASTSESLLDLVAWFFWHAPSCSSFPSIRGGSLQAGPLRFVKAIFSRGLCVPPPTVASEDNYVGEAVRERSLLEVRARAICRISASMRARLAPLLRRRFSEHPGCVGELMGELVEGTLPRLRHLRNLVLTHSAGMAQSAAANSSRVLLEVEREQLALLDFFLDDRILPPSSGGRHLWWSSLQHTSSVPGWLEEAAFELRHARWTSLLLAGSDSGGVRKSFVRMMLDLGSRRSSPSSSAPPLACSGHELAACLDFFAEHVFDCDPAVVWMHCAKTHGWYVHGRVGVQQADGLLELLVEQWLRPDPVKLVAFLLTWPQSVEPLSAAIRSDDSEPRALAKKISAFWIPLCECAIEAVEADPALLERAIAALRTAPPHSGQSGGGGGGGGGARTEVVVLPAVGALLVKLLPDYSFNAVGPGIRLAPPVVLRDHGDVAFDLIQLGRRAPWLALPPRRLVLGDDAEQEPGRALVLNVFAPLVRKRSGSTAAALIEMFYPQHPDYAHVQPRDFVDPDYSGKYAKRRWPLFETDQDGFLTCPANNSARSLPTREGNVAWLCSRDQRPLVETSARFLRQLLDEFDLVKSAAHGGHAGDVVSASSSSRPSKRARN